MFENIHIQTKLTMTDPVCNAKGFERGNALVCRIKPKNSSMKILKFLLDTFQSRLNDQIYDMTDTTLIKPATLAEPQTYSIKFGVNSVIAESLADALSSVIEKTLESMPYSVTHCNMCSTMLTPV
jgi:hypothetical protein